ncbi:hypothetical protein Slala05_77530 [Streptomyces lavendulae subsp. lavendulae]|nr:hypothetical protein Slala05_77530 [Streptomyces lavendulae subsp. lavendulae]
MMLGWSGIRYQPPAPSRAEAGVHVASRCISMEVRSDVSLSTKVSSMTLPARPQTGSPVELDEFGLEHQFLGVSWARHAPLQPIRPPGHGPLGTEAEQDSAALADGVLTSTVSSVQSASARGGKWSP